MKKGTVLLFISMLFVAFLGCSKDDSDSSNNTNNTQSSQLTGKNWTSYKIENSGTDVTDQVSSITITFNDNGTFVASGLGTASGSWTLSGNTLDMGDAGIWSVLSLTTSSLTIDNNNGAVTIYFH